MERWDNFGIKIVSRVQSLIAHKIVGIPMERIGARLGNGVDDRARRASVLRRIIGRQDGKLLNRIHAESTTDHASRGSVRVVVYGDSVYPKVIFVGTVPGARELVPISSRSPVGIARGT